MLELVIAVALVAEIVISAYREGCEKYMEDKWHILDVVVAVITFLASILILLPDDVAGGITVPVLIVRFALAPFRVMSTVKMVERARTRAKSVILDEKVTKVPTVQYDPRKPSDFLQKSLLSKELALELQGVFPWQQRYKEWELAFSPVEHGSSMNTFFRQQQGASLTVVRDQEGNVFGGFAQEAWRPQHLGFGVPESFVFFLRKGDSSLQSSNADAFTRTAHFDIFWAAPKEGGVIQQCTSNMFGFGQALLVHDEFLRGTTQACETFGCPQLSKAEDFVIRHFECWQMGDDA